MRNEKMKKVYDASKTPKQTQKPSWQKSSKDGKKLKAKRKCNEKEEKEEKEEKAE